MAEVQEAILNQEGEEFVEIDRAPRQKFPVFLIDEWLRQSYT
jgi:hypothetical protein